MRLYEKHLIGVSMADSICIVIDAIKHLTIHMGVFH